MILAFTLTTALVAVGAFLAGVGSTLSGLAAIKTMRRKRDL
jgi:hypothetical protein